MGEESGVLKINIYGTEYPLKSDAHTDAEYIQRVAEYVDRKMREIEENTQAKSSLKVAILAALNITDELFQAKGLNQSEISEMEIRLKNLSTAIDEVLK